MYFVIQWIIKCDETPRDTRRGDIYLSNNVNVMFGVEKYYTKFRKTGISKTF
jgi:hypothetical protein